MKNILAGKLENYKPLREIVFETLREAIITGQLKAGERLMEVQLAEEMGVSRTPVREAIRKLELEGFVVMIPRKGAYVADISTKDIADVFEIRAALEALAAALACERITEEELEELERLLVRVAECVEKNDLETLIQVDTQFHDVLYRASRNDRLVQIINNLREQIQRFRTTSLATPGRMRETLEEHKALVEAIAARNVELAQRLAQEHIENAENRMLEAIREEMRARQGESS
ncbi:transcriptional regulator, GntR family [Thermanaeromonas toyohensis ToBE]|uniref:Transcriptional regulator, GntR family n=1 Tax=Thermanaeromonas toyohensis ToBE TaxID=698762 RepID=A0A1W1V7X4_9FIRM|nr:GntR family transcriptional regulator [Thermanaeromonas toyohensis]SMB89442.1 transcriptional regulator, GntR family [Thermanaeromonas toyohensis ToBE]